MRIPEGVDLNHFNKLKNNINFEHPTFIWSGAHHKATFLNSYATDITGQINLITKIDIKKELLEFDYHLIEWSHGSFPQDIISGDIALLPRDLSSAYNQGHSEFKALVFAVSGIPIIANKLPSYVQLSHFYDGIVFLEDYGNDIKSCIAELKNRTFDVKRVRSEYDVNNLCLRLLKHLQYSLKNLI